MTGICRDKNGELYLYNEKTDEYRGKYGQLCSRNILEPVHLQPPEYGKAVLVSNAKSGEWIKRIMIMPFTDGSCLALPSNITIEQYENGDLCLPLSHWRRWQYLEKNEDLQPVLDLINKMTPEQKERLKEIL